MFRRFTGAPGFPRFVAAVCCAVLAACSEPAPPPPTDDLRFEPREGFDPRIRARRVDRGFLSGVLAMDVAPDGSTWMLRSEFQDGSFEYPARKLLAHFGAGGERLGELSVPDFIQQVVAYPGGDVTALGWEKQAEATSLQLRRLRPDGSVVAERVLRDDTPPEERVEYIGYADGTIRRLNVPEQLRSLAILDARAHGDDVYVLVYLSGLRILRLDPTLQTRWARLVAPSMRLSADTTEEVEKLGAPFSGALLVVEASTGRAHAALAFLDIERKAYADTFGHEPGGAPGRGILLTDVDDTGALGEARLVAATPVDRLTGLVLREGAFAVGGHSQRDLFLASGHLDRPASEDVTRILDVDQDDVPAAFVPCQGDRLCFTGHTGFATSDRNRVLDPGLGFLLGVDARGEQRDLALLEGARDTEVRAAKEGPGGSVVFAFTTDAPHDTNGIPNTQRHNELWLGVFEAP